VSWRR